MRALPAFVLGLLLGGLVVRFLTPEAEGPDRCQDVETLAGAITLFDLRLEAIERGCLWMPPEQRDLGVVQVRRKGR